MKNLFLDNFYYNVDEVRRYTLYASFTRNKDRIEELSDKFYELSGITKEDVEKYGKIDIDLEVAHKDNKIFLNFTTNYNNYISRIICINRDDVYDMDSDLRREYIKLITKWRDLLLFMNEAPFDFFNGLSLYPERDRCNLKRDMYEVLYLLSDESRRLNDILKNKLFIHRLPKENQKKVKFSVIVKNTGFDREMEYEGKKYLGLSHITEHLLYSKDDDKPISDDFKNHIFSNAYTSEFYTEYFHTTSTLLDSGYSFLENSKLLVENIFRKDISSELFDIEKKVVIDEISNLKEASYPFMIENSHKRLFFNNLPYYSLSDINEVQKDYTLEDVKRLINDKYNSSNIEFHIEGDIDSLPNDYKKVLSELYLKYVPMVEDKEMEKFDFKSIDKVFKDSDIIKLDILKNLEFYNFKDNMNSISFKYKSSGMNTMDEILSLVLQYLLDNKFNYIRKVLNKYDYVNNIFGRFTDVNDVNFLDENPTLSVYILDIDEDKLFNIKDELIKFINEFIESTKDSQEGIDKIMNHLLINTYERGSVDYGSLSDPKELYNRIDNVIVDYDLLKDTIGNIEFKGIIRYENK